jgi:hypothetical protein
MPITLTPEKRRSALETFSECQFRWHEIYVKGVKDESIEARRGTTFHACAKHYIRALFDAREASNLELAKEAFAAGLAEASCPPALYEEVHDLFWTWAEGFELDVDAYLLNEVRPVDPDDYKFQLDLAYARGDVLDIRDFKTYWQIWGEDRIKRSFQARFYAARARRIWPGFEIYRFTMVFVRFGKEVAVEFSAAQLDRLDDQVGAIETAQLEAMARGAFPATPGDHCGYCNLPCPVVDAATTEPVRLLTADDAVRVGGEYVALLQAIGARRKALDTYCALHGDVEANGVTFHHKPTESMKFSGAAVVDLLRSKDIQPRFEIGKTALKSFLTAQKWAHVRAALEALASRRPGSRFTMTRSAVSSYDQDEAEE